MKTLAAALLLALPASPLAADVREATFHSNSLGREVACAVQLPPSYASGVKRYPVLYALHGLFENEEFWQGRGLAAILEKLWAAKQVPEFLVVAVNGGNSFFVNAPAGRYEDLVTRDAIAYVESTYRVVPGREGRALMGISMGGYAALRIAFERPELFQAVSAHSAMLLEAIPTREAGAGRWHMDAFQRVFGTPIDATLWTASDPLAWAMKVDPHAAPALYFDCGAQDRYGLFVGNEDLHRRLEKRGVSHDFALLPGDHGYEYVRTVLERSLTFVGHVFRSDGAAGKDKA